MKISEYNLRMVKLSYNFFVFGILVFVGYRLFVIALEMFSLAQGREEQLLWIIIIGLMAFSIKFRFPRFEDFYSIHTWEEEEDD